MGISEIFREHSFSIQWCAFQSTNCTPTTQPESISAGIICWRSLVCSFHACN